MKQYLHIQELLDRYWEGETTLEEERELKAFFQAGNVPAQFHREAQLFRALQAEQAVQFATSRKIPMPANGFFKYGLAAAAIALLLTVSTLWFLNQPDTEIKQQAQTKGVEKPALENPRPPEIKTAKDIAPIKLAQTQKPKTKRITSKPSPATAQTQTVQPEDSFDDPEKALEEIKSVLALVSSKINKSKRTLDKGLQEVENVDILVKKKSG